MKIKFLINYFSDYTIISKGLCKSESNICPIPGCKLTDSPLCAINSVGTKKTYESDCLLKSNNCEAKDVFQFIHAGKCKDEDKPLLVKLSQICNPCSRDINYVCAANSAGDKTSFVSECVMRKINCETNTG